MSGAKPSVIRIEAVTKKFGAVAAVDGVTLDVRENEFLALLGASGCGKTTLLRLMAGLEQPDAGRVLIDGKDMTTAPPYARPVNMMFQSYALFPHMTVAANVAFGLKQDGLKGEELAARVREALAGVELEAFSDRKPHELSGGQKQRVALARCLAKRPRALLLDEPMAALDKHLRERTQLELMALRARLGITFIVVTHDQSEAMAMADRVAVMEAGRILQIAAPRELYEQPAGRQVAQFFGDINLWKGMVSIKPGTIDVPALDLQMNVSGRSLPPVGTTVSVALRPERIAMSRAPILSSDHNVTGSVQDVVYLGTTSTYFVLVGRDVRVRVVTHNTDTGQTFARGETVHLAWPSAAVSVLGE